MYILASDLKLEIRVVCREFLAFEYIFTFCSKQIRWLFIFVRQKYWKLASKTGFSVHNIHLVFSTCPHKYKWILCTEKPAFEASFQYFFQYFLKSIFRLDNIHLVFSTCPHKYKWILSNRKIDFKCAYVRFLMYKEYILSVYFW